MNEESPQDNKQFAAFPLQMATCGDATKLAISGRQVSPGVRHCMPSSKDSFTPIHHTNPCSTPGLILVTFIY